MPKRVQMTRNRPWRAENPDAVVVARPGAFGNPFTLSDAAEAGFRDPREAAVSAFRDWLAGDPWACGVLDDQEARRQAILSRLPELRGRDLACWCPPDQPCHADVLLDLANPAAPADLREQERDDAGH